MNVAKTATTCAMAVALAASISGVAPATAGDRTRVCKGLPTFSDLQSALKAAVETETSGLDLEMWGTIVNRDGVVCAVAFSGKDRGAQWPGSRVISAQKANTANAFSLDGLSLATANLYASVQGTSKANGNTQIGGSLYGLQFSNPVNTQVAYKGDPRAYGQINDPMVGSRIGGVNVFGGGLALYRGGKVVGAVGVSGDTSCADHMIAWRTRDNLNLDQLMGVGGISGDPNRPDNIIYDEGRTGDQNGVTDGFEHPTCINTGDETSLPPVQTNPS